MTATKQRDTSLDIICGLLILHMILGHLVYNFDGLPESAFFKWEEKLLFFFMPWFFFKNGMFYHPDNENKAFISRNYHRLIVPFIIWSVIGEIVRWIGVAFSEHALDIRWYIISIKTIFTEGAIVGNGPLWFLLSLFLSRILYNVFARNRISAAILMTVSVLIPMLCWKFGFNQFRIIGHTLLGLFYFGCGFLLRNKQRDSHVIALSGVGLFITTLISHVYISMVHNAVIFGDYYIFGVISSLFAVILVNNMIPPGATRFLPCKILGYIGKHSMEFYVTHWVFIEVVKLLLVRLLGLPLDFTMFWIILALCITLLPLSVKLLKVHTKLL